MRADPFSEDELSDNAFLGGRVRLRQPLRGYRAGIDPVLLAASVPAQAGDSVLDLGCGGGVAMMCVAARVPGVAVTGVEIQPAYADLARRNLSHNQIDGTVHCADVQNLPGAVRQGQFDHVLANPPYFDPDRRSAKVQADAELARAGALGMADWVDAAARRLVPGGTATFVQTAERAPELVAAMAGRLGGVALWPIAPRAGRDARLVLVRGRKRARAAFRLHAPLILHDGDTHTHDGDSYRPEVSRVLRAGEALPFPAT